MVLADRAEIEPLLSALELDADKLIEVVRYADAERALCTANDLKGFESIIMNARAVDSPKPMSARPVRTVTLPGKRAENPPRTNAAARM